MSSDKPEAELKKEELTEDSFVLLSTSLSQSVLEDVPGEIGKEVSQKENPGKDEVDKESDEEVEGIVNEEMEKDDNEKLEVTKEKSDKEEEYSEKEKDFEKEKGQSKNSKNKEEIQIVPQILLLFLILFASWIYLKMNSP